jgi:hypothetical protein
MTKMNVLVVGVAKTGTTVISKTIQHSLPGAAYHLEPKSIVFFERGKHIDSPDSQVVKIIFEHWNGRPRLREAIIHNETSLKFDRAVAVIRDPRDELLSRMSYVILPYTRRNGYKKEIVDRWIRLLAQKEKEPQAVSLQQILGELKSLIGFDGLAFLKTLEGYQRFLQENRKKLFPVRYEDFIRGELEGLQRYLGRPISPDRDVGELTRTVRTRSLNNWKRYFTPEDVAALKDKMSRVLENFGYHDWELERCDALDPEHGSLYVERLLAEYRG